MRYLFASVLLIMSVALTAQIGMNMNTPEGSVSMSVTGIPVEQGAPGNVIDMIAAKLDLLEKEIHSKLNKLDQKKAERIVDDIYDLLALLQSGEPVPVAAASASASSSSSSSSTASGTANININISGMEEQPRPKPRDKPRPPHHDEEPRLAVSNRKAISSGEFTSLVGRIKAESFSDDKLRVLRTAAKNYKFSVNQIVSLIGAYTFSEDKVEALRISYPEVTDPQNNYKILDAFTYSSDKEEADRIINE